MEWAIGVILAIAFGLFATVVGFDRGRGFYPVVMIFIAFLYSLFAVMGGTRRDLLGELIPAAVFTTAAVLGFRRNLWWTVAALAAHGLFDLAHPHLLTNPGVPPFWPGFCAAYDVTAAVYLAVLLRTPRLRPIPRRRARAR